MVPGPTPMFPATSGGDATYAARSKVFAA